MKNITLRETSCDDYEVFYRGHYVGVLDTHETTLTSDFITTGTAYYNCFDHFEAVSRLAYMRSKRFTVEFSNQDLYEAVN